MIRRSRVAVVVASLAASVAVVATSGTAEAVVTGSFMYSKNGNIHLAHADGSHDIIFKQGGWYWPSMDNNGVIAAERADRYAPDGTKGYTIHRFRQSGTQLSRQNTPSSLSAVACVAYPSFHLSLSPDGTKYAYDYEDCTGEFATWTPVSSFHPHGHVDYYAPSWLSNTKLTISHMGMTLTSDSAEVGVLYTSGGGTGWSTDLAASWATAYHATATRDGHKIALIEDDSADYFDGVARHVRLVFGTSAGPGQPITRRCSIGLPLAQFASPGWYSTDYTNLTFRPDGRILAFDTSTGIYKVHTGVLAGCSASTLNRQLWIRGGINPSFSPAADRRG